MKPILIIPQGQMNAENIKLLNDNGICTVEAKDPASIKFVDPIPAISSRTEIENAAIRLSRFLMSRESNDGYTVSKKDIIKYYMDFLIEGTPLDSRGTKEEQRQREFEYEKNRESARLAREEAKAERDAKKKELADKKTGKKKE